MKPAKSLERPLDTKPDPISLLQSRFGSAPVERPKHAADRFVPSEQFRELEEPERWDGLS